MFPGSSKAGFDERLVREALLHERQGGLDCLPQRDRFAQATVLVLGPGGGEHFALDEVEHGLGFGLSRKGGLFIARGDAPLSGLGRQGLLLLLERSQGHSFRPRGPHRLPDRSRGPYQAALPPPPPPSRTAARFRRANLRKRYASDGGQACTGSSSR